MEIRFVARAALVIVIAATLLLGPLGQVDGRAAGSMDVVPRTATAPLDAVTLSGGCPGQQIGDPVEQGSETFVYPTMLRVTLVGQQGFSQDITLENGQFSGETFDLPEGLPPGDYEFSAQLLPEPSDSQAADVHFTPCDPTATLTVLPPDVRATLNLDPERGDVGDSVTATGTCPTSNETTEVRFDDAVVGTATVNVSTGVISPVNFSVPDVDPGPHAVSTSCGGRAPFEVPPPPSVPATLRLEPASGVVGAAVTATGTCPVSSKVVRVYFGEESAGSAAVDPRTGQFGPVQFTVPNDGLGPVTVRTDCDARQTFTVTLPTAPSTSPISTPKTTAISTPPTTTVPGTPVVTGRTFTPPVETVTPDGRVRIVVPDLAGLTEGEVIAALGNQLRLANATGGTGRVSSQAPPPGTLVEPASAVSVVLASAPDPGAESSWLPLVLVAVAVAAVIGALVYSERLRRRHARERHWLESDVRTDMQAEEPELLAVPDYSASGLDVRLGVRRDPPQLEFQEVGNAHD